MILNQSNVTNEKTVIVAPNHRQTLDSVAIFANDPRKIHWAALKRFFDAEDSIFNNSKNRFLCRATAMIFRTIGAVPIDREGTTNKSPETRELMPIMKGAFSMTSHVPNCRIQPVAICWKKNTVIVNYRTAFSVNGVTMPEAEEQWREAVLSGLKENETRLRSWESGT